MSAFNIELRVAPTRTSEAQSFTVAVTPETTVAALRDIAAALDEEWSADGITLIRDGRHLDDAATVAACGLAAGDFVVMTGMRPRTIAPPTETEIGAVAEPDGLTSTREPVLPDTVSREPPSMSIER